MNGSLSGKVVINTRDLTGKGYSFNRWKEWSDAMEAAIKADLKEEGYPESNWEGVFWYRYAHMADSVICDLLFALRWAQIDYNYLKDENRG